MSKLAQGSRVAVIGGGPGGLTAAKHLIEQGLEPVVLEQSDDIGGQWHSRAAHSGIWAGMRTNTSKTMTAFSDHPAPAGFSMFPTAEEIHDYLRTYADSFGVVDRVRPNTRVAEVTRADGGWAVRSIGADSGSRTEVFGGVVVASGRYSRPSVPRIPGLDAFAERRRVLHAFDYPGRDALRGRRVVVYGNSISGLEISADLAAEASTTVISACRTPRLVIQKVARGVPADWQWFTRFAALMGRVLAPDELAAGLRQAVLDLAGDPASFGGLPVDPDAPGPGLAQCQDYLALVAEGRILAKPAITRIEGDVVEFEDGSRTEADVIVCATGYDLDLRYLSAEIASTIGADDTHLELHARTFHPELPGLAFIGQYGLVGPYLPLLELQARWVAGVWSGAMEGPGDEAMRAGVEAYRESKPMLVYDIHHALAGTLAEEAGVEPDPSAHPDLAAALLFGPLAPARYRLHGPGALPDAEALLRRAISELGPDAFPGIPPGQLDGLRMAAGALDDRSLAEAVERLAQDPSPAGA